MDRKDTGAYDRYLREENGIVKDLNGKTLVAVIGSSSNCICSTGYETHLSRSHHLAKNLCFLSLSLSLSLQGAATTGGSALPAKEEETHQIMEEK